MKNLEPSDPGLCFCHNSDSDSSFCVRRYQCLYCHSITRFASKKTLWTLCRINLSPNCMYKKNVNAIEFYVLVNCSTTLPIIFYRIVRYRLYLHTNVDFSMYIPAGIILISYRSQDAGAEILTVKQ